jgi:hypothetical protein
MSEPTTSEPLWPVQRSLSRYQSLLDIDISRALTGGGIWIDVGPGVEALPMLPFLNRPEVKLMCIGRHARSFPPAIQFRDGTVPDDLEFLAATEGTATLVTDVYSSVSYGNHPFLALAYCALLLKPGGICGAFTELKRLGDLAAWDRAIQFFRTELHTNLTLEALSIFEDASQSTATALRIKAVRVEAPPIDFPRMADSLNQAIGRPEIAGVIWKAADNSAVIQRVDYHR